MDAVESHAAIVSEAHPTAVRSWLKEKYPAVKLLSVGRSIDLFKDEAIRETLLSGINSPNCMPRTPSVILAWQRNRRSPRPMPIHSRQAKIFAWCIMDHFPIPTAFGESWNGRELNLKPITTRKRAAALSNGDFVRVTLWNRRSKNHSQSWTVFLLS